LKTLFICALQEASNDTMINNNFNQELF